MDLQRAHPELDLDVLQELAQLPPCCAESDTGLCPQHQEAQPGRARQRRRPSRRNR